MLLKLSSYKAMVYSIVEYVLLSCISVSAEYEFDICLEFDAKID